MDAPRCNAHKDRAMSTETFDIIAKSPAAAYLLSFYLLSLSTPFECDPLPSGWTQFRVKEEVRPSVEILLPAMDRLS